MRVLVIGAAGFIGFRLDRRLLERGDQVIGIDSMNACYDPALKLARLAELGNGGEATEPGLEVQSLSYPGMTFFRLGLEDRAAMEFFFRGHGFDGVCNLAAQAGVRYSIENTRAYVESNIVGFLNVLESCRAAAIPRLVYASSSSVYGLNESRHFSNHEATNHPMNICAATKKADVLMAHGYSHLFSPTTTGLRFFAVYGPWGRPDLANFKFIRAIIEGRPIDVYDGGDMLRDFAYIDDIVEGIVRVIDKPTSGENSWDGANPDPASSSAPYRVYNIGNSSPVRLGDFIEELERATGAKVEKRYLPMQMGEVFATEADVSDIDRDLGRKPSTPIKVGLARFARWYEGYRSLPRAPSSSAAPK
jgi:UDP-glucuronate 4-epimerase